ncbi:hypothetical protein [Pseudoxanthomonas dokdonensis]|uniref:Uncharacterized protein n=1 Tax=Pseudoxanthomonas dokdonensis TaxID=344882 RepID=A0A0R0CYL1_9GAMM|nr:hypothetical protein [Pseudoxanthomonas dokdonensis]KRG70884.1 hypothetical protein ABB29_03300 [Pseudoxanthomonas dokdonensis]
MQWTILRKFLPSFACLGLALLCTWLPADGQGAPITGAATLAAWQGWIIAACLLLAVVSAAWAWRQRRYLLHADPYLCRCGGLLAPVMQGRTSRRCRSCGRAYLLR